MFSSPQAGRGIAPVSRFLPFFILLIVLAGCATSDSGPGKSEAVAGTTRFWVSLRSRPQLEAAPAITDYAARGQFVVDELHRNAAASQGPLISFLEQRNAKFETFWVANAIWVEADEETRKRIADLPDVESIDPDEPIVLNDPQVAVSSLPGPQATSTLEVEENVKRTRAPEVWNLGAEGQNIVVGIVDTGVEWTHPALKDKYRGNGSRGLNHNYNWYNTVDNVCKTSPCDGNGHGTHVTGTVVGRDGNIAIGVAPGAKFIACKALSAGGSGSMSAVLGCYQWMLAPTELNGANPNPALRPQIVSASLGGGGKAAMIQAVANLQAAGILSVAAAGNSGGCDKVSFPGGAPDGLGVGALTADSAQNTMASFSSGGPAPGVVQVKPDLVAQGVAVKSAWPNNGYNTISGTSMATPAVSGVAALVMSAEPAWVGHPKELADLLRNTANSQVFLGSHPSCGGGYPSKAYGWGMVDAYAAVAKAHTPPAVR